MFFVFQLTKGHMWFLNQSRFTRQKPKDLNARNYFGTCTLNVKTFFIKWTVIHVLLRFQIEDCVFLKSQDKVWPFFCFGSPVKVDVAPLDLIPRRERQLQDDLVERQERNPVAAYVDHNFLREVCLLVQQQQKFWFYIYSKFGQKWLLSTLIIAVGFSISSFYHTSCQINLLLLEFLHSTDDYLHTSRCGKPEAAVDGSRVTLVNFNHGRSHSALPSLRNSFALAQTQTWLTERQKKRKNTGEYYSHQTADVLQELADHLTFFCINCHLGGVLASQSCTKMFSLWKCAPRYFSPVDKQNY